MTNQPPAPFEGSKSSAQLFIFLGLTGIAIFFLEIGVALLQLGGKIDVTSLLSSGTLENPDTLKMLQVLQIISSVVIFIVPVILFSFMVSRNRIEYLQVNRLGKLTILFLGCIVMLIASPVISFLAEINNHLQLPQWMHGVEVWMKDSEAKDDALTAAFLTHQTFYQLIANLIMIALVAAIAEELFFRGVLQKIFIKMTKNTHAGIWITGALFSAIHIQFYGFLPRMLMGVYLGYLLVWSGSLWAPVLAHFINNGTAVLFSFLEERNIISGSVEKFGSQSSDYWYVLISAALVSVLLFFIYRLSKKNGETLGVQHSSLR